MSELDIALRIAYNVKSFNFRNVAICDDFLGYNFKFSIGKSTCIKTTYVILDTPHHSAFGHWLYESSLMIY